MRFYFTFGFGHVNHDGTPLGNRYCVIDAPDEDQARQQMYDRRGLRWCTSYPTAEDAGVERWDLEPINLDELGLQADDT